MLYLTLLWRLPLITPKTEGPVPVGCTSQLGKSLDTAASLASAAPLKVSEYDD